MFKKSGFGCCNVPGNGSLGQTGEVNSAERQLSCYNSYTGKCATALGGPVNTSFWGYKWASPSALEYCNSTWPDLAITCTRHGTCLLHFDRLHLALVSN